MKAFAALQTLAFLQSFHQQQTHNLGKRPKHISCMMSNKSCNKDVDDQKSPMIASNATGSTLSDETSSLPSTNNASVCISSILPPLPFGSRRIYLLRHGETDWNVLGKIQGGGYDIPLNENGRQQAMTTALALEDIPLGVVVSSNLSRAMETADILWARHNETVQDRRVVMDGLAEMRFGEFEGLAWRDQELDPALSERFKSISRELKKDVDNPFPGGGESTRDVQIRSSHALHQILNDYPDQQHIAIISHGRTNKVLIAATAMGDVMQYPGVKQSNTCINVMDVDADGNWTIQTLNFIDHVRENVILR